MQGVLNEGKGWFARLVGLLTEAILAAQPLLATLTLVFILMGWPQLQIAWGLALLPVGVRLLATHRLSRRTPFDIPIAIFALGLGAGVFLSPARGMSLVAAQTFASCILIYYGLTNNSTRPWYYWQGVGLAYVAGALLITASYFAAGRDTLHIFFNTWAFRLADALPKLGGSLTDLQVTDGALVPLLPLTLALVLFARGLRTRLFFGLALLFFLGLLILSASGRGWLALLVGFSLVLFYFRPGRVWWLFPLYSSGTFAFTVAYLHRLDWLQQVLPTSYLASALRFWQRVLVLLKWPHVAGLGLGTWPAAYAKAYGGSETALYSSYVELLADMGVFGLAALLAAAWAIVRLGLGLYRAERASPWYGVAVGLMGGVAAGAVQALFEVTTGTFRNGVPMQYLGLPLLWGWAALLVVSLDHLAPDQPVLRLI